jgi:hypothetical protein
VLAAAALGVTGWLVWRQISGGQQARAQIQTAIANVSTADETIIPVATAVGAEVGENSTETLDKVISDSDDAVSALDSAQGHVDQAWALSDFLDDSERDVLSALSDSIDARRQILGVGKVLLDADSDVSRAREATRKASSDITDAAAAVKASVTASNAYSGSLAAGTAIDATAAAEPVSLDQKALDLLADATSSIATAKEAFSQADYSAYETFLEKRTDAVGALLQADQAMASGDYEAASTAIDQYNQADSETAALASALPSDIDSLFVDAYTNATATQRASYQDAVERAAMADERIRSYQGVSPTTQDSSSTSSATASTTASATTATRSST